MRGTLYLRHERSGAVCFDARSRQYSYLSAAEVENIKTSAAAPKIVEIRNECFRGEGLSAPLKAFFNITRRCNLHCRHCYNDSGHPSSPELPLPTVVSTLRALQAHGIMKLTLAGGEPLFHQDFQRILDSLRALDLDASLITNGISVSPEVVEAIASTPNINSITVSLDGGTAAANDTIRGRGSFERTLAGIRLLRSINHAKLAIRTTVTEVNAHTLQLLPQLALSLGVTELKCNRLNPYGRATERTGWLLSDEDFERLRDQLLAKCSEVGVRLEIPAYKYQIGEDGLLGLCRAGEETCEIDANGAVYPCSFSAGRFVAGHVGRDDFGAILQNLQRHSINNDYCLSCRGRGGTQAKPIGYVPTLITLRGRSAAGISPQNHGTQGC